MGSDKSNDDPEEVTGWRKLWRILRKTFRSWLANEPLRESAVISFFAIISMPALMVLLVNFLGLFLEEKRAASELSELIKQAINPATAEQILASVKKAGAMKEGFLSTTLGIAVILFAATRVFIHLQKTLDNIWGIDPQGKKRVQGLVNNLFSVGLIVVIGLLLVISMFVSTFLSAAGTYLQTVFANEIIYLFHLLDFLASLLMMSALFAVIFKYLPSKMIYWRQVTGGAVLTAFLFLVLKYAMSIYFARATPGSAYGAAGTIFLVMWWVAISSMILFFGAEFTRQYSRTLKDLPDEGGDLRNPKGEEDQ